MSMALYKDSLHSLKEILLVGEVAVLMLRLISQMRFTVPSALEIIQALIAGLIYCRNYCTIETQVLISPLSATFYSTCFSSTLCCTTLYRSFWVRDSMISLR